MILIAANWTWTSGPIDKNNETRTIGKNFSLSFSQAYD